MKYSYTFLKIDNIAGVYYSTRKKTDTLIIYGIGAPITPDNGSLPDSSIILQYHVDLFVPDYIGYGRSDGIFTPMNCINTFLYLYEKFKDGCVGINHYANFKIQLVYKRIIFIGRSIGGTYIPLLPRFNRTIHELALFCPVIDSKSCGSITGEESNADFLRSMRYDGYHYLYRGILDKKWIQHLNNKDDLSPMDNITYLQNVKLFIGHGKKDTCVHYSKSQLYYKKILKTFPKNKTLYQLKLYPHGDHGIKTTHKAVVDFFHWLRIIKQNGY